MKRFLLLILVVLAVVPRLQAAPAVALFYMTGSPDSIRSFLAHSSQIDLLVPTWYHSLAGNTIPNTPPNKAGTVSEIRRRVEGPRLKRCDHTESQTRQGAILRNQPFNSDELSATTVAF